MAKLAGWALVIWVVVFWRLGYPSFWDPGDEANYAQATREMFESGNWLVPTYNGAPFFDKPILFYTLQLIAFSVFGPNEFAARMVPALSALVLFAGVWWLGRRFFSARAASLAVLMLALLPSTFALSSYAILDMTFTALLFAGLALISVAVLQQRPRLEMPGYALVALAVLTKGPLALALAALALVITLIIAPDARRLLLRSRWLMGLGLVVLLNVPWFSYMWARFGAAFIDGYVLKENIWLFMRGVDNAPAPASFSSHLFYLRVVGAGLLPWTPVLLGRLVDIWRGDRCTTEERLLWAWTLAVVGFFSISSFKLDHYVYPAAPSLCLLAAHAWWRLRDAASVRPHLGTAAGVVLAGVSLVAGGLVLIPAVNRVPLGQVAGLSLVPIALLASGIALLARVGFMRLRPPAMPAGVAAAFLFSYGVALHSALPEFERGKPVKDLGRWAATQVSSSDQVCSYRMERWNTSWRFYVERQVQMTNAPAQLDEFLKRSGPHFCLMLRRDYEQLVTAGYPLTIVREAPGIFTTTGRALTRGGASRWQSFVVVSDAAPAVPNNTRATSVAAHEPAIEPRVEAPTPSVPRSAPLRTRQRQPTRSGRN